MHLQKKINSHPLIKLERPDKKLYSLGIILIPYENLEHLEKYQPSPCYDLTTLYICLIPELL